MFDVRVTAPASADALTRRKHRCDYSFNHPGQFAWVMQSDKTMSRGVLDDLAAFAAVARTRSFSRAAAELNVSNSMLSYTIKRLESRLGYPLLRRTSRSVAPTAEGQTLL